MFDNIVVYRNSHNIGPLINKGLLAEALLFYGNVHLLLNRGTLSALWNELGTDGIERLLDRPEIRFSYLQQNFGTVSAGPLGLKNYNFAIFEIGSTRKARLSKQEEFEQILERSLGQSQATRRHVKRLLSATSFPRVEDDLKPDDLTKSARGDLDDPVFVQEAVAAALQSLLPSYRLPNDWYFRILKFADGSFAVDTNLNFDELNREYHKSVPVEHSSISPDYLLTFLYDSHVGTYLASRYSAEFIHDPLCSSIMKLKYVSLFRRRERSVNEIDLFQDLHLEGRPLSEVLNRNERTFDEFLQLLEKATKFKAWLRGVNPDQKLLEEYFQAVTRETWADRLPARSMRWVITTGLATAVEALYPTGAAIAAAQGLGLADATVLDKILHGWKPDQFVKGPMSEFVGAPQSR
jgi:hypothetical protein